MWATVNNHSAFEMHHKILYSNKHNLSYITPNVVCDYTENQKPAWILHYFCDGETHSYLRHQMQLRPYWGITYSFPRIPSVVQVF